MPPPTPLAAFVRLSAPIEARCKAMLQLLAHKENTSYDRIALSTTEFVSCSPGRTEWSFTVTEAMCNASHSLHGGCAATILDDLTSSAALTIAKPGFMDGGTVSRGLNCVYLKGVPVGTKCKVICEVVKAGKTLICFKGEIIDEKGDVCVTCLHDKVARTSPVKL